MNVPLRSFASASVWLAAALVLMPLLQLLPIDFDRTGTLFLLLPFLWSGRSRLGAALGRLSRGPWWLGTTIVVFVAAVVAAVFFADQFAPAVITAACWVLFAATALIAGELIALEPVTGPRLLGAIALGVTAGTLAVWLLWWWGGRGAMPLYAHHRIFGLHMLGGSAAAAALLVHFWNRPVVRTAWFAVGAINWGGLLWSGSRGPALALFLALLAWWLLGDATLRRRLACAGVLLLAAGLLLSLAMWSPRPELGWWNALHRTAVAHGGPALSVSAITSTRSEFWRESLRRIQLRPWLGHGPDAYRFLTPKLDGQQPHNFILQLLLDVGAIGAGAALCFLAGTIISGWRHIAADRGHGSIAPWLVLVLASTMAGLLDGVFYHLVALLPATIALGAVSTASVTGKEGFVRRGWTAAGHSASVTAIALIALHTWVFYSLAVAPPPAASTAWPARIVRAFPSTTFGLWRWLDAWQPTEPESVLVWSRWAQVHSVNPPFFHLYTARLLLARGDREGAVKELQAALTKAHWSNQPAIAEMLRGLESSGR